jgi:hypothetical protein
MKVSYKYMLVHRGVFIGILQINVFLIYVRCWISNICNFLLDAVYPTSVIFMLDVGYTASVI